MSQRQAFTDPLTGFMMLDPVILVTGNSFDRDSIEKWLASNDIDPVTKEKLSTKMLFPNAHLRKSIDEHIKNNADTLFVEALTSVNYNKQLVQRCIRLGANVNNSIVVGETSCPPIHAIAYKGDDETLEVMLQHGCDVDAKLNGVTAFFTACAQGHTSTASILCKYKADVNTKDLDGYTPLFYAVNDNATAMVEFLINNGADTNERDTKGNTALHIGIKKESKEAIKYLLSRNPDLVDVADSSNVTPLHRAAQKGSATMTEILLQHKANINKKTNTGFTALHYAAKADRKRVVYTLLEKGADIEIKNEKGKLALDIASPECAQMIQNYKNEDMKVNSFKYITRLEQKVEMLEKKDQERVIEIQGLYEQLKYMSERLDDIAKQQRLYDRTNEEMKQNATKLQLESPRVHVLSKTKEEDDPIFDEIGLIPSEIELVMKDANVSRSKAVKAIKTHNGDIPNAILGLKESSV
jgi:ankyrin repeat protein